MEERVYRVDLKIGDPTLALAALLAVALGLACAISPEYVVAVSAALLGVVVVMLSQRSLRASARSETPNLPYRLSVVAIVWSLADVAGGFASAGPTWRYVIIVPLLCAAALLDGTAVDRSFSRDESGRRTNAVMQWLLVALSVYLIAVAFAAFVLGRFDASTTVLLVPAIVTISYFAGLDGRLASRRLRDRLQNSASDAQLNWRRIFDAVAFVYAAAALTDAMLAPSGQPPEFVNHEHLFVLAYLYVFADRYGLPTRLMIGGAVAISTFKYPTATLLVLAFTTALLVTVYLCCGRTIPRLTIVGVIAIVLGLSTRVGNEILENFYARVGRTDNSETRLGLWQAAISQIERSPVFGDSASRPLTAIANIDGKLQPVPVHNSILTLALYGGVLAAGIFSTLLLYALWRSVPIDRMSSGSLLRMVIVCALIPTLIFNPVLEKLGTAPVIFVILIWISRPRIASGQDGSATPPSGASTNREPASDTAIVGRRK